MENQTLQVNENETILEAAERVMPQGESTSLKPTTGRYEGRDTLYNTEVRFAIKNVERIARYIYVYDIHTVPCPIQQTINWVHLKDHRYRMIKLSDATMAEIMVDIPAIKITYIYCSMNEIPAMRQYEKTDMSWPSVEEIARQDVVISRMPGQQVWKPRDYTRDTFKAPTEKAGAPTIKDKSGAEPHESESE